jgi:hypothetical protein
MIIESTRWKKTINRLSDTLYFEMFVQTKNLENRRKVNGQIAE